MHRNDPEGVAGADHGAVHEKRRTGARTVQRQCERTHEQAQKLELGLHGFLQETFGLSRRRFAGAS